MGFLTGSFSIHGYGFGLAKPSGFVPIAIAISIYLSLVRHLDPPGACAQKPSYIEATEPLAHRSRMVRRPMPLLLRLIKATTPIV
jgi:hypothetical protein